MHFEYKITADEYAAAQALYHRANGGRKRLQSAVTSILVGAFFAIVAWNQRPFDWAQFFLAGTGAWWLYAGIVNLTLPIRYFRKGYATSGLEGTVYQASVDEEGFGVRGDLCSWHVKWSGLRLKAEDKSVFMLSSFGTIFIFGKQYLSNELQEELRRHAGFAC